MKTTIRVGSICYGRHHYFGGLAVGIRVFEVTACQKFGMWEGKITYVKAKYNTRCITYFADSKNAAYDGVCNELSEFLNPVKKTIIRSNSWVGPKPR